MTTAFASHGCTSSVVESSEPFGRCRAHGIPAIDLHCHILTPEAESLAAAVSDRPDPATIGAETPAQWSVRYNQSLIDGIYRPKLTDISVRLADMKSQGIDVQVLSPSPTQYYYWANREVSSELVRLQNEHIATVCALHPKNFLGLGTVSLQYPELAAEQSRHAVRELGLRGIEISSLVNGVDVDDARFHPFWTAMEELGAAVLLHPLGTTAGKRLDEYYLSNIVGQPAETTISLSRMIFSGHFDRFKRLKICAVHGGGYLPLYMGRSDRGYAVRPESRRSELKPREYLQRIWFDTVVHDRGQLRHLIEAVGVDRIVLGTDYPFDMGEPDPLALLESLPGLTADELAKMFWKNAHALLGLSDAPRRADSMPAGG